MSGPSWSDPQLWPSEDGWPYADGDDGPADTDADPDDDLVSLHALSPHLFDDLEPLERQVVTGRFGLDGRPSRSIRQLARDLGAPRDDLRAALSAALAKLRAHLD